MNPNNIQADRERYRSLLDSVDGIVWEADSDFTFTFVSRQAERILGYPVQTWLNEKDFLARHIHPDDRESTVNFCREQTALLQPHSFEYRMIAADGRAVWLKDMVNVESDARGKTKLRGIMVDISRLKEIEGSLAKTISQLHATVESTADGILVVDTSGKIQGYNRKFLEMWRIPEALIAKRDDDKTIAYVLDQLTDPSAFLARVRELYSQPEKQSFDVLEFKDGRIFERYSQPQTLNSEYIGRVWSFRDVTERKRAEVALRESEDRFRRLSEATRDGIAIHEKGKILVANESLARMFGYEPAELPNMSVYDLSAPESHNMIRRNIQRGHEQAYEVAGLRKNGTRFWVEIQAKSAYYHGRPVRVATARDITDRKRVEEQQSKILAHERAARLEAERSSRLRDEFIAIATHELKTPLTSLKLYLELLGRCAQQTAGTAGADRLAGTLRKANFEFSRLAHLIDALLDVSRISAKTLVLHKETCDLSLLVRELAENFSGELKSHGSRLSLDVQPNVVGQWDRSRLEGIVSSLLMNALKYGLGRPIRVSVRADENFAYLSVEDQGIGIGRTDQRKLFGRFERAAPVQHYGGLGLSLYIAKEVAAAHGGSISVESAPGRGAVFTLKMPLRETEAIARSA